MQGMLTTLAMALDTLPGAGRMLLLAVLLSMVLTGFGRVLLRRSALGIRLVYRKGVMLALVFVPTVVGLANVQMPVHVVELVVYATPWPGYVSYTLLAVWCGGAALALFRLGHTVRRTRREAAGEIAAAQIQARCAHWCRRLNLPARVEVRCAGSEQAWHVDGLSRRRLAVLVMPAASVHWPMGVVDVMLLHQLAQLEQRAWRWLLFARVVQALYWPLPWVGDMVSELAELLAAASGRLAGAAYRDPEGWRRDVRKAAERCATLADLAYAQQSVRLPGRPPQLDAPPMDDAADKSIDEKWAVTKARLRRKYRDPYRQAYWLIAAASVLVAVATTLTLVKAPPEFEPRYLNVRWQDKMVRRLEDYYEQVVGVADAEPPPGGQARSEP